MSHASLSASTARPSRVAVIAFVHEPTCTRSPGRIFTGEPRSRTPATPKAINPSLVTIAAPIPRPPLPWRAQPCRRRRFLSDWESGEECASAARLLLGARFSQRSHRELPPSHVQSGWFQGLGDKRSSRTSRGRNKHRTCQNTSPGFL